jgi:hypothetical protein
MALPQFSKLKSGVRFSYPAPNNMQIKVDVKSIICYNIHIARDNTERGQDGNAADC